jgi:hypothetical protein
MNRIFMVLIRTDFGPSESAFLLDILTKLQSIACCARINDFFDPNASAVGRAMYLLQLLFISLSFFSGSSAF